MRDLELDAELEDPDVDAELELVGDRQQAGRIPEPDRIAERVGVLVDELVDGIRRQEARGHRVVDARADDGERAQVAALREAARIIGFDALYAFGYEDQALSSVPPAEMRERLKDCGFEFQPPRTPVLLGGPSWGPPRPSTTLLECLR